MKIEGKNYFLSGLSVMTGVLWKCEYDNIVLAINGANEVNLMDRNIVDTKTTLNFIFAFISQKVVIKCIEP